MFEIYGLEIVSSFFTLLKISLRFLPQPLCNVSIIVDNRKIICIAINPKAVIKNHIEIFSVTNHLHEPIFSLNLTSLPGE